jgi:hypothetical protein
VQKAEHSAPKGGFAVRRKQAGQATVELALCLPFVALLLAALVEVGMLAGERARLWHAAREAARVAVVDPDPAAARAAAERTGLEPLSMSVDPTPAYRVQGRPLTVSLIYHPDSPVPLLGAVLRQASLRADATMRIEQP